MVKLCAYLMAVLFVSCGFAFGQDVTFQIVEGNFTWQEAKADAETRGGRLAVLNTQAKIDAANTYLEKLGSWPILWLGLSDEAIEGEWRWITGEAITADNWRSGEPSNVGGFEHFAHLWHSGFTSPLEWNDADSAGGNSLFGSTTGSYLLEILDQTPPAQGLNKGLVAYYPFNGNANDESGNNRHLSTQGQPTFEEGINGLLSAQFDDNADGFEITGQDTPENIGAASVSVWFEQDDPSGSQVVVALSRARTSRFIIYLENGLIHFQHGMERGGRLEGGIFENQPTLSNGWNNFVLTTSGNGGKVSGYLNGQFLADVSAGINLTGLTDYMIGAYTELAPADRYRQAFRGSIQNLRIYNRALSEQEVTTLYGIESQNTQFQIIGGNFTWQEAKADAEAKGGRLAVLNTQAKIDAANAFLRSDDPSVWIGLTDEAQEGQWKWITGEPLTVSNWYQGEPNNLGNEDYAVIWSNLLAWNDAPGFTNC